MHSTKSIDQKVDALLKQAKYLSVFNELHDTQYIDLEFVSVLVERSQVSVWRDVKRGRLPKPVSTGVRQTRWRVSDIREYLKSLTPQ